MKKLKEFIGKYIFSDELSLDARMINMICLVGMAASLVTTISRIAMGLSGILIFIMFSIILLIGALMFVCNRFHRYNLGIWITLLLLCNVLFPAAFFYLGGSDGGMTAFFVLSIVIIFLLLKGLTRVLFLIFHTVLVVICYYAGLKYPYFVNNLDPVHEVMDNILSFLVSGFFIGAVILFQSRIYRLEKDKADKAGNLLARRDKLLHVVNNAAALLLSSEADQFDYVMEQSMGMMARDLDVEHINIWRNFWKGDLLCYTRICSWVVDKGLGYKIPEDMLEFSYQESLPRWEDVLSSGNCVNGPVNSLDSNEKARFGDYDICSLLVIPVFLQNAFWGFVSFDDSHNERIFSDDEVSILRSGSLLLANALVRNDEIQSLVQAREDALAGTRAKSDFLANMSHEIRTPMNAIIGMTAIAKSTNNVERKDICLEKIENASTHLLGVINDVLDMSKIEANKLDLSYVSFDFEKMLQRVANVINFRVDEKKQNFSVHIDRRIPRFLIGDDQRLAQVITNLLSNSVKFTPEQGSVKLNARFMGETDGICTIQIEVTDTGIGIDAEQQTRVFTSFEQADTNTSRKFGGTGLGLAISKRIVEMMGGKIWLESELNKGSTFAFTIQAKKDAQIRDGLLEDGLAWNEVRILAVDDDPYIREYFSDMAQQFNFYCDTAASGEEAIDKIEKKGPYDIYFIDWKMPGMNGIETTRRVKELVDDGNGRAQKSVVIMISATEWNMIEREARSAGVDKFLSKPLFPSYITDTINTCLGLDNILAVEESPRKTQDDFEGHCILLAEDVDINREIVQALLEPTRISIDYAENGLEAVRLFTKNPDKYEIIFMDVQMPEMDGYEATRKIRELEHGRNNGKAVPIIAMTANVFREDIEKCLEAGMNGHLGKPLDLEEVLKKLRRHLH
ncbi:MAG: response regulator [Treponema sp.]|nr:response regulator [Treponema sp.]